jgi:hypothetical protein
MDLGKEKCRIGAVYPSRSQFQPFQSFNRYALIIHQSVPIVPAVQSLRFVQSVAKRDVEMREGEKVACPV